VLARAFVTVPMKALPPFSAEWVRELARGKGIDSELTADTPVIALVGSAGRDPAWNDRKNSRGHVGIPLTSASFIDAIPMMSRLMASLGGDLKWIGKRDVGEMVSRLGTATGTFYVAEAAHDTDAAGRRIISAAEFVQAHGVRTVFGLGGAFATGELIVVLIFCSVPVPRAVVEAFQGPLLHFKAAAAHLLGQVFVDGEVCRRETDAAQRSSPALGDGRELHQSVEARLLAKQIELDTLNAHYLELESQLEHRTRSLKLILDSTGDGMLLVDAAGKLVGEVTAAVARWFSAPTPGMSIESLLFDDDAAQALVFRESFAQLVSDAVPFEAAADAMPQRLQRRDATLRLCYHRVREKEHPARVLVVIADVTAAVAAERAQERARELLATTSRLKDEFLANMSHEIRTPLNGVVGMAELLSTTVLDAEQRSFLSTLLEACHGLRTVVDDILDFSKIEAGKLSIDAAAFDLQETLHGVINMFHPVARRARSQLSLVVPDDVPARVVGDCQRIRQVLMNLVSNAVKFTTNGSIRVRVSFAPAGPQHGRLRVEVADTGIGISEASRAELFQPFVQADGSITRRFGGTGLGLTISRRLVELMGGSIGVESELSVGSTFWFELPLASTDEAPPRPLPRPDSVATRGVRPSRILVGEDNAINRQVISAMLRALGCEVALAHDGKQVVESWRRGGYDAILMDCQMPEMSGFEAARAIRREERGTRLPIIALTAQAYAEDRERCERAGMDDHLPKPVSRDQLRSMLAKWLVGSRPPAALAPMASATQPERHLDVVALDRLLADLGEGSAELLVQLVDGFLSDLPEAVGRMRAALGEGVLQRVAAEAHRLRSSTGNLGMTGLSASCRRIELSAKSEDRAGCERAIDELNEEFATAGPELSRYAADALQRLGAARAPAG
jgi:signal transduction histidine kinase/DNA-binding NarL/FixJ family response regulator